MGSVTQLSDVAIGIDLVSRGSRSAAIGVQHMGTATGGRIGFIGQCGY
jgi:hypothetical protein